MADSEGSCIQVAVRVRPMNEKEERGNVLPIVNASEERKEITIVRGTGQRAIRHSYNFDHVFTGYTTQNEVFEPIESMIDSVMQGYEATVFAYGQTGTGKTHTMEGNLTIDEEKGVIPRAVESIFQRLGNSDKYSEFSVSASYLEIYNEEMTDLLVELPTAAAKKGGFAPGGKAAGETAPKLEMVEDTTKMVGGRTRGTFVKGLSEHAVTNASDVLRLITRAQERRQVQETNMNKTSSRSHCVFSLSVSSKSVTPEGDGVVESSGAPPPRARPLTTRPRPHPLSYRSPHAAAFGRPLPPHAFTRGLLRPAVARQAAPRRPSGLRVRQGRGQRRRLAGARAQEHQPVAAHARPRHLGAARVGEGGRQGRRGAARAVPRLEAHAAAAGVARRPLQDRHHRDALAVGARRR